MTRLLYIAPGGVPTGNANAVQIAKMCDALVTAGHDVTIVSIKAFSDPTMVNVPLRTLYGLASDLRIHPISTTRFARPYDYAARVATFAARTGPYDIVFSRHLASAWAIAILRHPGLILELHAPPAGRLAPSMFGTLAGRPSLRTIVTISDSLATAVRERWPQAAPKVRVLRDGFSFHQYQSVADKAAARRLLGWGDRPAAVYVGSLYDGRGIDVLARIAARLDSVLFHIVGRVPRDSEQRWPSNVRLHGFVHNAEVPRYLSASDVLLMPYQTNTSTSSGALTARWMSPLKLFEYMASGRPIVASDLPALREVLSDAEAALVPADSVDSWVLAISQLLNDPLRAAALGQAGRAKVLAFSWEARAARVVALCDEARSVG